MNTKIILKMKSRQEVIDEIKKVKPDFEVPEKALKNHNLLLTDLLLIDKYAVICKTYPFTPRHLMALCYMGGKYNLQSIFENENELRYACMAYDETDKFDLRESIEECLHDMFNFMFSENKVIYTVPKKTLWEKIKYILND